MFFARFVFFLCLWRGISAKWEINSPKTPQNHSRQRRNTKVSELYSSDWFWGWNITFCGIYETFHAITCVLPRSIDQITNNVRVQLAYQITEVTRPQTHRVVCLWAHHVHADALRADARWIPACSERTSRWKRRGSAGWIETSKLDSRGVVSNAQVWKSCVLPCTVIVPVRRLPQSWKKMQVTKVMWRRITCWIPLLQ